MKKNNLVITILLLILAALCYIFFDILQTKVVDDVILNVLLRGIISRAGLSLLFVWLLYLSSGGRYLFFNRNFLKGLLWSIPLFLVALVNFPYSALAQNGAGIDRPDLIAVFVLYAFCVALLEEIVFRGTIFMIMKEWLKNSRHAPLLTVVFCSLIFALFHFTNLLAGTDIISVLLQVTYTFLIGAMLTVCMLKVENLWLCVVIHGIFNIGGLIIYNLGHGEPHDLVFWILTIAVGVLCAGHVIYTLIKLDKDYASR